MKTTLVLVACNLVSLTAVCAAAYLAAKDARGWGWFIVVALLCHSTPKSIS